MLKEFIHIIAMLIFVLLITACSTPQEKAAQRRQQRIEMENEKIEIEKTRQRFLAKLSKKCRDYGFKAETNEFAQCLQQAEQQDLLARSVQLQQQQVQQNEKNPFKEMMDADKNTRELFKDK